MNFYTSNIEQLTLNNPFFRQVLFTDQHCQLVVMSLKAGEEIGAEVHNNVDQFFRIESGEAKFVIGNGEEHILKADEVAIVPAGTRHNVINTSTDKDLKLYTIYAPPAHFAGTVQPTKADEKEEA